MKIPAMKYTRMIIAMLLLGQTGFGWSYPWDQDMVDQPSVKPQESLAPPDPGSVPIVGGETMPSPTTTVAMDEAKDAAAVVPNPVPVTPESLERGKYLYGLTCVVCHGADGKGSGTVGSKFITKAPVDLNDEYTQDQADGQLFFTLTRGRELMPNYRDALSIEERWDVINYVRQEFGIK